MSTSGGSLPAASAGPAVVASRLPPATRARPPVAPRRRNCARVVPWVCTGAPLWSASRLGVATPGWGLLRGPGAFGSLLQAAQVKKGGAVAVLLERRVARGGRLARARLAQVLDQVARVAHEREPLLQRPMDLVERDRHAVALDAVDRPLHVEVRALLALVAPEVRRRERVDDGEHDPAARPQHPPGLARRA